jgi:hypothetical protein
MNLLAAIFVAGVGAYTITRGPRSWPHWLAGCAALGFAFVDRAFLFEGENRGVGFTFVAAMSISAVTYLVHGSARNLPWVALALAVGTLPTPLDPQTSELTNGQFQNLSCLIVGLMFVIFLIAPQRYWKLKGCIAALFSVFFLGAILDDMGFSLFYFALFFMPLWGGAFLIFTTSKYRTRIENACWRIGLVFIASGFILAFLEFRENIDLDTVLGYTSRDPALRELSAWLPPLLVAIGIVATCFAVVRLIPRQPDAQPVPIEPADQTNPL